MQIGRLQTCKLVMMKTHITRHYFLCDTKHNNKARYKIRVGVHTELIEIKGTNAKEMYERFFVKNAAEFVKTRMTSTIRK